jgi:hypothetical protein
LRTVCSSAGTRHHQLSELAGHWAKLRDTQLLAPGGAGGVRQLLELDDADQLVKAAAGETLVHCGQRAAPSHPHSFPTPSR